MKYGKGRRKKTERSRRNALKWRPNTRRKTKAARGDDAQRCQEEEAKRRAVEEQRAREAQERRRMEEEEKRKGEKEN